MNLQLSDTSKTITKRPIIVTIVCCIALLSFLFSIYAIKNYLNENTRETLMEMIGEKNYYIGLVGAIINIVLIIPLIGIWKMKKSMGYAFVIIYTLALLTGFISDTIPGNMEMQKYSAIASIIPLTILFIIIYHVIINNPKTDSSILKQKQFGIFIAVIGIVLLIISQTVTFTISNSYDLYNTNKQMGLPDAFNNHMRGTDTYIDTVKKNLYLYYGLFIFLGGVIFFILTLNSKQNGQLLKTENAIPLEQYQTQNDIANQIEKLNDLFQKGILTKEEFDNKKTELLSKM